MTSAAATTSPRGPILACCTRTTGSAFWPAPKPRPGSSAANTGKTSCTLKAICTSAGNSACLPNSPGKTTSTGTKAYGRLAFTRISDALQAGQAAGNTHPAGLARPAANRLQQRVLLPGQGNLHHPGPPEPGV